MRPVERSLRLHLPPWLHDWLDVIVPLALDYQRNILAPLDADERAQLAALMAKLEAPLKD